MTVADVYERFPDEWVLMHITHPHGDYRKERGRVLAHSPNREDLYEPHDRFRTGHPSELAAEFFAGEIAPGRVVVVL